jgi:hypothetical protein
MTAQFTTHFGTLPVSFATLPVSFGTLPVHFAGLPVLTIKLKILTIKLKIQTNNLKVQTINLKIQTINLKIQTINLKIQTINLKTQTNNLKIQTNNLKVQTINLKTQTINLKIQTNNLKIQTNNLKTQTNNLKIQTGNLKIRTGRPEIQTGKAAVQTGKAPSVARHNPASMPDCGVGGLRCKTPPVRVVDGLDKAPSMALKALTMVTKAGALLAAFVQFLCKDTEVSIMDWMPTSRVGILAMCVMWMEVLTAALRVVLGIPAEVWNEFVRLYELARELYDKTLDEAQHTHVITVECNTAFADLKAQMRYIHDRYLRMPPLTAAQWVAMGMRLLDKTYTAIARPGGSPIVLLSYGHGKFELGIKMEPEEGTPPPSPHTRYGYSIYFGIMPVGGATLEEAASEMHYLMTAPLTGEGLHHYCFTRNSHTTIVFDPKEAGKTVYIFVRYENEKGWKCEKGSNVAYAVIPG